MALLTTAKKEEAEYWSTQFNKCKTLREQYEKDWYLNLAFFAGKQYVQWNPANASSLSVAALAEPPAPRYRVRLVANKIKPAIRNELTKLTREEPQFFCVPQTPEPDDVAAAKAAETITDYLLDYLNFKRVRRQATFWALICGVSFIKTYTYQGKDPVSGEPANELGMDDITAFHLYVPHLQEPDLEKQPYVIHARAVSPDDIKAQWGVDVKPAHTTTGAALEQKFLSAIGIRQNPTAQTKDLCFLKEIWVKPCERYPNGGMLIYAEDTLVYAYNGEEEENTSPVSELTEASWTQTKFPFDHGKYPFDKIEHIPSGSFYATSVISDLIPLQKEYNKTRSQIVESKNRTGKPQWTYVQGSLDPKKVTSEPGLMIPIKPGFEAPKPVQQVPIPGYVIQELDRTLRDMDDLTGQYEVSKGRTPPGVEAASAIAYLQEENDSRLYHTVASIEEAVSSVGKKLLSLVQQYWDAERIQQIVSKNASFEAYMFKMSALGRNMDIRVESGSMAPKSRAAKQAFITELMKMGIIPPEKGLRYLEMNETTRLYEEMQADSKHAQRENFYMSQGGQVPVNPWDNTAVHLHEHGLFLKSQSYELLDDNAKAIFVQHYMEHKQVEFGELNGFGSSPAGAELDGDPAGNQQQLPF